jgi:hypothetical protein
MESSKFFKNCLKKFYKLPRCSHLINFEAGKPNVGRCRALPADFTNTTSVSFANRGQLGDRQGFARGDKGWDLTFVSLSNYIFKVACLGIARPSGLNPFEEF